MKYTISRLEGIAQEPGKYSCANDKLVEGVDSAAAMRYITERSREAEAGLLFVIECDEVISFNRLGVEHGA